MGTVFFSQQSPLQETKQKELLEALIRFYDISSSDNVDQWVSYLAQSVVPNVAIRNSVKKLLTEQPVDPARFLMNEFAATLEQSAEPCATWGMTSRLASNNTAPMSASTATQHDDQPTIVVAHTSMVGSSAIPDEHTIAHHDVDNSNASLHADTTVRTQSASDGISSNPTPTVDSALSEEVDAVPLLPSVIKNSHQLRYKADKLAHFDRELAQKVIDGRFKISRTLGVGGCGAVLQCEDVLIAREVAVKVDLALCTEDLDEAAQVRQIKTFFREGVVLSRLESPFIMRIHHFGRSSDKMLYQIMELIRGQTLQEHLAEKQRMDDLHTLLILRCILLALQHAHDKGVVHCDLKPANILVSTDLRTAKLIDWGIAQWKFEDLAADAQGLSSSSSPNEAFDGSVSGLGTFLYMSIEQMEKLIRSDIVLDGRSDLFAVGLIAYECLTGVTARRLYPNYDSWVQSFMNFVCGQSRDAAVLESAKEEFQLQLSEAKGWRLPLDGLDANLAKLVQGAIEADPADRFTDAQDMLDVLDTVDNVGQLSQATLDSFEALRRLRSATLDLSGQPVLLPGACSRLLWEASQAAALRRVIMPNDSQLAYQDLSPAIRGLLPVLCDRAVPIVFEGLFAMPAMYEALERREFVLLRQLLQLSPPFEFLSRHMGGEIAGAVADNDQDGDIAAADDFDDDEDEDDDDDDDEKEEEEEEGDGDIAADDEDEDEEDKEEDEVGDIAAKAGKGHTLLVRLTAVKSPVDVVEVDEILEWLLRRAAAESSTVLLEKLNQKSNDMALTNAVVFDHLKQLELLRTYGAKVYRSSDGRTLLDYACMKKVVDESVVHFLLEGKMADLDTRASTVPLLFYVCNHENVNESLVRFLVEQGADVNAAEQSGQTALHALAEHGHLELVRFLLDNGANIDAGNRDRYRALHYACERSDVPLVRLLLERGAATRLYSIGFERAPLHHCRDEAVAELLLDHGADIHAVDCYGTTVLFGACELKCDNLSFVRLLLQRGATADINQPGKYVYPPLFTAVGNMNGPVVQLLLDSGADIHALAKDGRTILHTACRQDDMDVPTLQLLLQRGASTSINKRDKHGRTPLIVAVLLDYPNLDILRFLLENGADPKIVDARGNTVLSYACSSFGASVLSVVRLLLDGGATVHINTATEKLLGRAPLHYAARCNRGSLALLLLDYGADIHALHEGLTLLQCAQDSEMVDLLSNRGCR